MADQSGELALLDGIGEIASQGEAFRRTGNRQQAAPRITGFQTTEPPCLTVRRQERGGIGLRAVRRARKSVPEGQPCGIFPLGSGQIGRLGQHGARRLDCQNGTQERGGAPG